MAKKILKDVKVQNKQVLVRVDFNVPMEDGKVTDDTRIRAALPTIEYLIKEDAKVILMAHLGRPGGEPKADLRLDPVAKELANLLNKTVYKTDETVGAEAKKAISQMEDGDVVLLENTRFNPGEKKNDPEFAKQLGELADIYVNDAFGATHRAHASTAGVTKYVDEAVMGFLIQNELETMGQAIENPDKPFVAIIGGAKVSGKIGVIETFLDKVDALLIGGGMANTFLAAKGYETGDSLVEEEKIDLAKELIEKAEEKGVNLSLPVDVMVADDFTADAAQKIVIANEIEPGWQALDIGPETIKSFAEVIKDAQTVVWNGPMGVFEMDPFAKGTTEVARALAESNATTIIGGGDSAAAVKKAGLDDQMTHISTGGGASLQFMEGKPLQAVEALDNKE
ncbi:phosphoglycerate kinase [Candidatus Frackibacter sp. WG12]|uniref:phosphoglycerate kinase n=1 Tax=Candidatus Frackibacter sp. WG12 TaxID=2017977 RepID=UPI0008B6213C|nr:phosphoglycerate kinase [Candidatus Frackibacter sp. WG12]SEM85198.1 phosphoglycerate kinase [Candidatus Frackibacter sp. WG12]